LSKFVAQRVRNWQGTEGSRRGSTTHSYCSLLSPRVWGLRHVFRTWWRNSFLKQCEKAATFLRLELVSNNVRDFRLKKSLAHRDALRQRFQEITDRFTVVQAQNLNVHGQLDVLARLAQPVLQGKTKVAGIKLQQKRILRLPEVLLPGAGGHLKRWTTAQLQDPVLARCGLKQKDYTLKQIRYDLRKLRLHGHIERIPHSHAYRFTQKDYRLALPLIQLRKRINGPLAFGILRHRPNPEHRPASTFERPYHKIDTAFDEAISLLAA
jgi:hypothetical protein